MIIEWFEFSLGCGVVEATVIIHSTKLWFSRSNSVFVFDHEDE